MRKEVFVRTPYNYDMDEASNETAIDFTGTEDKTQQQFAEEVDINTIVRRFGLTGELPDDYRAPQSGDFTGINDYQSALNAVIAADAAFMEIPADVRERFNNDPQRLMTFLHDEKNRDEALKLGLLQPPPEKTRDMVQAVDELREAWGGKPPPAL